MQIRCQQCHKPFGLSKEEILAALDYLEEHHYHHYDANCPHCKRANRVSKDELHRAAPEWGKKTTEEHA